MPSSLSRSYVAAGFLVVCLSFCGCNTGPKLVPVEGQVTLDGKPLEFGSIQVIPVTGRPAFSELDSTGHFKLWTDDKEGCAPGTHTVTVASLQFINDNLTKRYAPAKYDNGISSDMKLTVDTPKKDVVIELKSDGQVYPLNTR